jgi:Toprim domain
MLFGKAAKDILGTPVETYLASRGIDLRGDHAAKLETRWLRYQADATYFMADDKPQFPAMLAGMVDGLGVHRACHWTFLAPDGRGKARVPEGFSTKLMWPRVTGLVVRIAMGESGLSCEDAMAQKISGPLVMAEGIEDALSIAIANPECRVWAAGSLPQYLSVPNLPCVSSYVIARDNDWGKPQAAHLFEKSLERIRSFKKPVAVIASTSGKDFNDQLRGD